MEYEINVSYCGEHYFATAGRSIGNIEKVRKVYQHFRQLFPECSGYRITVTRIETRGRDLTALLENSEATS